MTTVAVIQARQTSTRLPGKMTLPLAGRPVIAHIAERARLTAGVDAVRVTVPDGPGQDALIAVVEGLAGVGLSVGPEDDLARRFAVALADAGADTVLRLWGDCPAIDPEPAAALLAARQAAGVPFATIPLDSGFPEGMEAHAMTADAVRAADAEAEGADERECPDAFLARQPERFPAVHLRHARDSHALTLLLDTAEDHRRLSLIFEALYPRNPVFGVAEIEALAAERPALFRPDGG